MSITQGSMRFDNVAPQRMNRGLPVYLVPPPPRPISASQSRPCSPLPQSRHPYETIEFSPPPSQVCHLSRTLVICFFYKCSLLQNVLGEDLGRILPNEEPLIFEQTSIPLASSENSRDQAQPLTGESDYIVMTPR